MSIESVWKEDLPPLEKVLALFVYDVGEFGDERGLELYEKAKAELAAIKSNLETAREDCASIAWQSLSMCGVGWEVRQSVVAAIRAHDEGDTQAER